MRRKLKLRTILSTAAPLLFAALPVVAEEAPAPTSSSEPIISVVSGLAPDDLLNIRATASAIGKTEARLPSGTAVKNYGCNTFNGYPWCKVEDAKNPAVVGWAPARYLSPNNPATVPADQAAAPAPQADAGQAQPSPPGEMIASVGPTAEGDAAPAPVDASATSRAPRHPVAPPPDLAARLGASGEAAPPSVATITGNAMQDAVGLAYAASDNSSAGDVTASAATQEQPAEQAATPDEPTGQGAPAATDDPPASADAVPVPTPRPDGSGKAADAKPETVARLEPKPDQATTAEAGLIGDIPCARYVGQPMTHCAVKIVRGDDGKADITVSWPDGGTRTISFLGGQPAKADSRGEFRFTREGSLNMIRIGVSERFEITDTLALGD